MNVPIFTAASSCRISRLVAKPQEKVVNSFPTAGKNMLFSRGLYFVSYTEPTNILEGGVFNGKSCKFYLRFL